MCNINVLCKKIGKVVLTLAVAAVVMLGIMNFEAGKEVQAAGPRTNNAALGCDVSSYQGKINWQQAKQAGIQFAIIRVGYRSKDGSLHEDIRYRENLEGAINAGIKVGCYFYSDAINEAEAIEEANFMLERVAGYNISLPLVVDYENFGTGKGDYRVYQTMMRGEMSKDRATEIVSVFCEQIASNNYTPCVYSSASFFKYYLNGELLSQKYNIWSAAYSKAPENYGNTSYDFWQYTSSADGATYGMSSQYLDMDYWYTGSYMEAEGVTVTYTTHVQDYGNMPTVSNGAISGVIGQSKRMEGIWASVSGANLGISYTTHVQDYGWLGNSSDWEMSGTHGQSKRVEALMMKLTGADADQYDLYYRVHVQDVGWMGWAKNGEPAGTAGKSLRIEAIQIVVTNKDAVMPGTYLGVAQATSSAYLSTTSTTPAMEDYTLSYTTHVQDVGWQETRNAGAMSGTSGKALRLEGIKIDVKDAPYEGGIEYRTHVQNIGWQDYVSNGEMAGTSGQSLRLEAIQIRLTGELAEHYDVYYRVHAQNVGWMNWACNGESAGTAGLSYRLEGIQIVLMPKNQGAPGNNLNGITNVTGQSFIGQ